MNYRFEELCEWNAKRATHCVQLSVTMRLQRCIMNSDSALHYVMLLSMQQMRRCINISHLQ